VPDLPGTELERGELDTLAQRWLDGWHGHGFEICCTPDVSYEDPVAVQPLRGVEELERHAIELRRAIPDLHVEATAPALARAGHACFAWRASGTHRGDFGSMFPATDRPIALHGMHFVELTDGLVRRARGFFDLYDGATQLGLLPTRGGLGETALLVLRGFGLRRRPT
jgi:steroid delta-isomerase-like uncharacterized protein